MEGGIVDSLGILEIVAHLESNFGMAINDADVVSDNFVSIAAIARFVDSRQPAAPPHVGG